MLIVDRALAERRRRNRPVVFGIYGAGFMAKGIANQMRYLPAYRLGAMCNRDPNKAADLCRSAGIDAVRIVSSVQEADDAIAAGACAVTDDPSVLAGASGLECLVEATGHVGYGARVTLEAIAHRKHMVLMNAELDATVGPLLKRRADEAGVILAGCDGDQPAAQINLLRFVEGIGLVPRVCGNIKGLQDRYRTPATQAAFAKQWGQTPGMVTSFADGTKISFEQAIVANATGMKVGVRGMYGRHHDGHVDDLVTSYDLDELRRLGGVVDYVVGPRPGPGVYVYAEAHDDVQAHYLNYGKLGQGPLYSFYTPYHLTVFEVPLSVARVALFGDAPIAPLAGPVVDVITVAKTALRAGQEIDGLGGFLTYGMCEDTPIARRERLLPMGLAEGCTVTVDLEIDQPVTLDDVEMPTDSVVHELWREQCEVFG